MVEISSSAIMDFHPGDKIMIRDVQFDIFLPRIKAQSQKRVFQLLAQECQEMCGVEAETLYRIFQLRLDERTFGMGRGISIFDVKSPRIKNPVLVMATFENMIDFNALDAQPVNLMAAVISPVSSGPGHLQTLAAVSRLMLDETLCEALREAHNIDSMRALFLVNRDQFLAA